mgnify:CR=1 FL=1
MNDSALSKQALSKTLLDFAQTRKKIAPEIIQTPLLKLDHGDNTLYIKPECFQSIGSFKIRSGASALVNLKSEDLKNGIITASAGNFGQGLAKVANSRNLPLKVIAPDTSSKTKIKALKVLGAHVEIVSFDSWWNVMMTRNSHDKRLFIHPVSELSVILGNGSVGLEVVKQLPKIENIIVPFGGGGLISGIALAARASGFTGKIIGCEIESSTPLTAAKKAGKPVKVERGKSWVDGIGSNGVLREMWPLLDKLVDDVIVVSHSEAAAALRSLAKDLSLISEGAGAVAVAAGMNPRFSGTNTVSIVSGGNIDFSTYASILGGNDY